MCVCLYHNSVVCVIAFVLCHQALMEIVASLASALVVGACIKRAFQKPQGKSVAPDLVFKV